ncbi:MAG: protein kinase [Vicinamibacterales bacterium]
MSLTPGSRLGVFQLIELIGRGGMGEVYRATDTKLKRQVAIKILPPDLVADRDRLGRFQREAEVLASLNHPNIAAIYGLEESEGITALVMELVEGDDLSQRTARGAIPVDEALPIAKQIAEALEAAHEQGIVHRDLKPANIKVRPDGTVKVLDFGLAKAMEPVGAMSPGMSQSPTITTPAMTQAGMILGTAAYMSPEQAKGRTVDKRSDVWAFGAVLYEMLTGQRAFEGDDVSEVLASVLAREPDWIRLPVSLSPALGTCIRRCLRKDPKQRFGDMQSVRLALEGAFETAAPPPSSSPVTVASHGRSPWVTALASVAVLGMLAMTVPTVRHLREAPPPAPLVRMEITTAGATALSLQGNDRDLAITPDGSRIVYRGENQLLVRALDQLAPTPLTGLGQPRGVFLSPDGQWVGFFDGGTALKKVAITGGPPVTLNTTAGLSASRGATWGEDGTVIFADNGETGLLRVSASGGDVSVLTTPNRRAGESDHQWPEFLPGGQAVLFTITQPGASLDNAQVAVLDLRTNTQTILVRGGYHAHYVSSGHLVYGAAGTLRAVPFDLGRLAVVGTPAPAPVLDGVATTGTGSVDAVVAGNGTLVYVPGGLASARRSLVWVDRAGREEPISAPPRAYVYAQISPDGTKVALDIRDQEQDVWIWDLARATLQRLSFDPGQNRGPVWSRDGQRVAFSRPVNAAEEIYWQAADGSGVAEALTEKSTTLMIPSDFSPDGKTLLYDPSNTPRDIWMIPVTGPRTAGVPLLNGPSNETNPAVSPDGRSLAYESNESGQAEIYVRPFPMVNGGRWQISTGGGTAAHWSHDGRELFFYVGAGTKGTIMAVPVETGPTFRAGLPKRLFQGNYPAPNPGRGLYDVSRDGKRFLMIKGDVDSAPKNLTVVLNWTEELKRLVPTK